VLARHQASVYAVGVNTSPLTTAPNPFSAPGLAQPVHAPWRVLIVEDDPATRDFFANSVRRSPQLHCVADVGSVAEACAWLGQAEHSVDVLMTDLGLPDGSGLEIIRYAMQHHPQCEALVISMFGDEDNVLSSIEAGATGYIHKDSAPDDIAQSVLQLKAGMSPISPMIARRVLTKYRSLAVVSIDKPTVAQAFTAQPATNHIAPGVPSASGPAAARDGLQDEPRPLLSLREQEVLELIARGFSYLEISNLRSISVHTVQTHIKNLYAKLAVHSKNEAVYEATRLGLLPR
jgi:DNA-binding NarL/FixJ family response regulator